MLQCPHRYSTGYNDMRYNESGRGQQKMVTKAIMDRMPNLYESDGSGADAIVGLKLFKGSWTWLITEINPESGLAFGYAYDAYNPHSAELGGIDLNELRSVRTVSGYVERDAHWTPKTLREAVATECPDATPYWSN